MQTKEKSKPPVDESAEGLGGFQGLGDGAIPSGNDVPFQVDRLERQGCSRERREGGEVL